MNSTVGARRTSRLAPFGKFTRYVFASHLRHVFIVSFALLAIALSVDIPPQITATLVDKIGLMEFRAFFLFAALRAIDLMPTFLPLAAFLGVVWTHIALTQSRERILIWNTGRSPFQCLLPAALITIALGSAQFLCDAWLRPAAMAVQIQERLGVEGKAFSRAPSQKSHWLAIDGQLLHSRIQYGPPSAFLDLTVYRLDAEGRFTEVDRARSAVPSVTKGTWLLHDGRFWKMPSGINNQAAAAPLLAGENRAESTTYVERPISLSADPLWISVWGINPEYLSLVTLTTLIANAFPNDIPRAFVARRDFDYANAFMPGAMALFAESICLLLFAYSAPILWQLGSLLAGYGGHLMMKTFVQMGAHLYIGPIVAVLTTPICLVLISVSLLTISQRRARSARN